MAQSAGGQGTSSTGGLEPCPFVAQAAFHAARQILSADQMQTCGKVPTQRLWTAAPRLAAALNAASGWTRCARIGYFVKPSRPWSGSSRWSAAHRRG